MLGKSCRQRTVAALTTVLAALSLAGCQGVGAGMEGNLYEKMTIFSLIALTALAVLLLPFLSSGTDSKALARYRVLIRNAAPRPLSAAELTGSPVYLWDSPKSFHTMRFGADGSFSESVLTTTNGIDPAPRPCGSWSLSPAGELQIARDLAAGTRVLTRVSPDGYNLATLMRLGSGLAEAWFLGEQSLAKAQISCFGYSGSRLPTDRFRREALQGVTVYWATYPALLLSRGNEVTVNPELCYGAVTFHPEGALSKSISNTIDAPPDFRPSFTGSWKVDENFGVLNMSTGLYTTEVKLLLRCSAPDACLVGTTSGNEQWFLDPEKGREQLFGYLGVAVHQAPPAEPPAS